MDENAVKIGGGRDSEIAKLQTWSRWSPFAFGTLKEIPFPSWVVPFVAMFFCLIWHGYEKNFDNSLLFSEELAAFVQKERSSKPLKPAICIVGSSASGMGFERSVLSKKLGSSVEKITTGANGIRESANMIKKYDNEFRNTQVVIVEYAFHNIQKDNRSGIKKRFQFLKSVFDTRYSYMQLSLAETVFPMRFSLRDIKKCTKTIEKIPRHDDLWYDVHYKQAKEKEGFSKNIKKKIDHFRKPENSATRYVNRFSRPLEDSLITEAIELADYCKKKGIFVVFAVPPMETNCSFPQGNNLSSVEYKYLASIRELQNMSNCSVIIASNFDDILSSPRDYEKNPSLTFDGLHMTYEGATIYTNWFADQVLKDTKILTALKTPRKPEEFFVKKYAKKSFRKIVSWLKMSNPKQETEQKPVLAAQTPKSSIK